MKAVKEALVKNFIKTIRTLIRILIRTFLNFKLRILIYIRFSLQVLAFFVSFSKLIKKKNVNNIITPHHLIIGIGFLKRGILP